MSKVFLKTTVIAFGIGLLFTARAFILIHTEKSIRISERDIVYINKDQSHCSYCESFQLLSCDSTIDTLYSNLPYSYAEAITELTGYFRAIDSSGVHPNSLLYLKAMALADFVFAAFSYRFMGDETGIVNDSSAIRKWEELPLSECFNLGNNNFTAVYCGNRTDFYCRLADSLLQLKTEIISIDGIHTFPLSIINGQRYLIDPYDPFTVFNSENGMVLDYDMMQKTLPLKVKVIRSTRIFGCSRELISIPFLKEKIASENLCDVMSFTLQLAEEEGVDTTRPGWLKKIHVPDFTNAQRILNNRRFYYSLRLCSRPEGFIGDYPSLDRFYF